jgi:hypothetical protein
VCALSLAAQRRPVLNGLVVAARLRQGHKVHLLILAQPRDERASSPAHRINAAEPAQVHGRRARCW